MQVIANHGNKSPILIVNMHRRLGLSVLCAFTFGFLAAVQGQSFLTNGLVAYYPFNGNAHDESGNGNNATTILATLITDRNGKPNSAYFFNGLTDYIDTTDSLTFRSLSNRFTITFWVNSLKTTNQFGAYYIISKDIWASSQWAVYSLDNNTIRISTWRPAPESNLPLSRWTQFSFVSDGVHASCYMDGRIVTTVVTNLYLVPVVGAKLRFGGARYYTGEPVGQYYGALDDVRVYNRPLSSNELASLYYYESRKNVQLVKSYTLDFDGLVIGTNYQLQVSTNLVSWTNWGSSFTANTEKYTNVIPHQRVDDWSKLFFRLNPQ